MSKKTTYEELEQKIRILDQSESTLLQTNYSIDESEWYRSILDTINEGVILQSSSGDILMWNKGAEEIFGISAKDATGQNPENLGWHFIKENGSEYEKNDLPNTRSLRTGSPCRNEIMGFYRTPDNLQWLSVNTHPLFRNRVEKPYAVAISFSGITELKIEKDTSQNYLDVAGVMILALNEAGEITLINRKGCEILGGTEDDFIGKNWFDLFTPEDILDEVKDFYQDLIDGRIEAADYAEYKIVTFSGAEKLIAWHTTNLKDKDGKIIGTLNSGEDITEKKNTEDRLKESERQYRTFLQTAMDGFLLLDMLGNILEVNDAYCKMSGYSHQDLLKLKITDLEAVESKEEIDQRKQMLDENTQRRFISLHRRKDGSLFDVEISNQYRPEEEKFVCFLRDITEQRKAQESLREREELLSKSQEMASLGSFVWEIPDNHLTWSRNMYTIHGVSNESYDGDLVELSNQLMHPDDLERVQEEIYQTQKAHSPWDTEFRIERPNGEERIIRFIGEWEYDAEGEVEKCYGIYQDITERRKSEKRQENLQTQLSNAVEIAQLGPWEYDVETDLFTFNDYFYKIFRTTVNETGGYQMSPEEYAKRFVHPDDLERVREETQKAIETDDPAYNQQVEHKVIFPDGTVGYVTVRIFIEKDENGKTIKTYGVNQDITERKRAEEMLRESEEKLLRSKKMESLGLLAGGVAHDLNNVLSGIVSYPELLLMDLPGDSKYRKPIQTIHDSGTRAVAIVQDLLTIARGVHSPKEPLNLNDIIEEYQSSPEYNKLRQYHPTVTIKTDLNKDLMNINGSSIHIRKVIMNLVSNASEAIEGRGNVIISTDNRYVDRPVKGYEDVKAGEYVVLTVSDDGSGIPSGHLERIFEPFFSKKVMGRSGTGLGLAVVWNILQDHEGYIDVSSDEKGTTFELYFPIIRKEVFIKDLPLSIEDYKGNGESVLVIDDVENQREITCKMLEVLGYKAVAVSSGEEAVAYLKGRSVDIILLDMIMDPGIGGRETYERIKKIHPKQKAIIVSGFAETDEVKETQKLGAGKYIKKPLTMKNIGVAIKEVLG